MGGYQVINSWLKTNESNYLSSISPYISIYSDTNINGTLNMYLEITIGQKILFN